MTKTERSPIINAYAKLLCRPGRTSDLGRASNVLAKRLPYMNLEGLARLPGLMISLQVKNGVVEPGCPIPQTCFYFNTWWAHNRGDITLVKPDGADALYCTDLFPHLPPKLKLGTTVLTLITARGNLNAGRKLHIEKATEWAKGMARKMDLFMPKLPNIADDEANIQMTIPTLNDEELMALELFWERHPLEIVRN